MLGSRFTTLSALTAFVFSLASVTAKPLVQFKPRTEVDICADIDADLSIGVISFGKIEICICLSEVTSFLSSGTSGLDQAVSLFGAQAVTKAVNDLILNSPNQERCVYPDNCTPVCQGGNPCGFQCNNNFVPYPTNNPTQCVCPPPYTVCNGKCGLFNACASLAPNPYSKRDLSPRDAECNPGWKYCKIPGREVFECVDVMNDLWSCGGCEIQSFEDERVGIDCTVIPDVAGVSCIEGVCKVQSCRRGFGLSDDKTSCTSFNSTVSSQVSQYPALVQNGKGPFKV